MTNPPDRILYDGAIPQPLDTLPDSQIDFQNNFRVVFDKFHVNHVDFATPETASPDEGKHIKVDYVRQPVAQQTIIDEMAIYDKAVNDIDQLFLRFQQNSNETQWTAGQIYELGNNRYYTFVPGGFIVYFGVIATSGNPTSFFLDPKPTNIVSAFFSGVNAGNLTNSLPFIQLVSTDSGSEDIDQILLYLGATTPNQPLATSYNYIVVGKV